VGWSHWNLETGDLRDFRHVATPSCKFITHDFMLLFTKNSPRQGKPPSTGPRTVTRAYEQHVNVKTYGNRCGMWKTTSGCRCSCSGCLKINSIMLSIIAAGFQSRQTRWTTSTGACRGASWFSYEGVVELINL